MTTIDTSTEAVGRLLDGVTPGPWELRHNMAEDEVGEYAEGVSVVANGRFYVHEHELCFDDDVDALIEANARFIAAARDLVPALLKERDEARAADTVTLVFSNADATAKNTRIICDQQSIAPIMAWYGAYHAGDRYTVALDGRNIRMDQNGEPINE